MNEPAHPDLPPPIPSATSESESLPAREPVESGPKLIDEPPSLMNGLRLILKQPGDFFFSLCEKGSGAWGWRMLVGILLGLAAFGLVMASFSGGNQYWAVPLKLALGTCFATVICFPSFVIFAYLSGTQLKPTEMALALLAMLSLTTLLLLGFAPVVWLFAVSSNSLAFVGALVLLIWFASLSFGIQLAVRLLKQSGISSKAPLHLWAIVMTVVTFQLSTTLRPMLGDYDRLLKLEEKRFFLGYWLEQLGSDLSAETR